MANDDFFDALDQAEAAEAEQGRKILEAKDQKRVRYWYEEGYVPGNERDSDDEDHDEDQHCDGQQCEERDEEEGEETASNSGYEEVRTVLGGARGGQHVRWGGINGRLALADAPEQAIAKLDDVLDELLLPQADVAAVGSASNTFRVDEVTAIVLAQLQRESSPWSNTVYSGRASERDGLGEEFVVTRQRFALEDGQVNARVRSEQEHDLSFRARASCCKQRQAREEFVRAFREEERRKRSIEEGSRERLPGARKPLPLSQAWQERKAAVGGTALEPVRPTGRSMLPCSLSGSSSSMSQESLRGALGRPRSFVMRPPAKHERGPHHV